MSLMQAIDFFEKIKLLTTTEAYDQKYQDNDGKVLRELSLESIEKLLTITLADADTTDAIRQAKQKIIHLLKQSRRATDTNLSKKHYIELSNTINNLLQTLRPLVSPLESSNSNDLFEVLSHLDISTVKTFSQTSKSIKEHDGVSEFWRQKFSKYFPSKFKALDQFAKTRDWQNEFNQQYKLVYNKLPATILNYRLNALGELTADNTSTDLELSALIDNAFFSDEKGKFTLLDIANQHDPDLLNFFYQQILKQYKSEQTIDLKKQINYVSALGYAVYCHQSVETLKDLLTQYAASSTPAMNLITSIKSAGLDDNIIIEIAKIAAKTRNLAMIEALEQEGAIISANNLAVILEASIDSNDLDIFKQLLERYIGKAQNEAPSKWTAQANIAEFLSHIFINAAATGQIAILKVLLEKFKPSEECLEQSRQAAIANGQQATFAFLATNTDALIQDIKNAVQDGNKLAIDLLNRENTELVKRCLPALIEKLLKGDLLSTNQLDLLEHLTTSTNFMFINTDEKYLKSLLDQSINNQQARALHILLGATAIKDALPDTFSSYSSSHQKINLSLLEVFYKNSKKINLSEQQATDLFEKALLPPIDFNVVAFLCSQSPKPYRNMVNEQFNTIAQSGNFSAITAALDYLATDSINFDKHLKQLADMAWFNKEEDNFAAVINYLLTPRNASNSNNNTSDNDSDNKQIANKAFSFFLAYISQQKAAEDVPTLLEKAKSANLTLLAESIEQAIAVIINNASEKSSEKMQLANLNKALTMLETYAPLKTSNVLLDLVKKLSKTGALLPLQALFNSKLLQGNQPLIDQAQQWRVMLIRQVLLIIYHSKDERQRNRTKSHSQSQPIAII